MAIDSEVTCREFFESGTMAVGAPLVLDAAAVPLWPCPGSLWPVRGIRQAAGHYESRAQMVRLCHSGWAVQG